MVSWSALLLPSLISAVLVFIASSLIHMVVKWHQSEYRTLPNEDEVHAGSGRFGPVMYVWTGCILYVGVVMLVNQAVTGTYAPVHVAGF